MTILAIRDLRAGYGGGDVLKGINLELEGPGAYGILGPNGAGKTTLFRVIVNALKPSSGSVELDGQDPGEYTARGRAGYMPQTPFIFPSLTVEEIVAYHAACRGLSMSSARREARLALERLGIEDIAGRRGSRLSYGQARLALMAAAIAGSPDMLVLDEPLAGIGGEAKKRVLRVIEEEASSALLLVSSHELGGIEPICREVIMILNGSVAGRAPPSRLKAVYRPVLRVLASTREAALKIASTLGGRVVSGRLVVVEGVDGAAAQAVGLVERGLAEEVSYGYPGLEEVMAFISGGG